MEKKITYNGKEYTLVIKWSGSTYCVRTLDTKFVSVPQDCWDDIEKVKPYIIESIENKGDLDIIKKWDGKI